MKRPWAYGTDSESGGPGAVLEHIVHACLERQRPQPGVGAAALRANIDERLSNQSAEFLSWAQDSRDQLDRARAEASRTELAGWVIAGALVMYLALAAGLAGSRAGLTAVVAGCLAAALAGRLAWRLRLSVRDQRRISDARRHWEKVLEEAIALPLIAQEVNRLAGDDVADTMDAAVATLTGNGRDPEVPVISAAMKNVAATARTIGSGSIGISGPRGAGKSTVLNKFDTRDAAWKPEQDIRVSVAAPVDYDAREFIIHLFTELCTRVAAEAPRPDRIAAQTQRHLEDLRFQRTYSSSWGPTLMPASFLSFSWSRGRQRAEQPAGLPALVAQFRAYSQQVAEWNWDRNAGRSQASAGSPGQGQRPAQGQRQEGVGRVIICIDEMDKIRDSDRAEQFLNNIKAIFDVPGCLYLVAISEDAMTVFASRTPAIRTAFDSAFDEIISVAPMEFPDARQLLQLRTTGVPLPFLALCHVLAGGVPRELVRAARALMQEAEPSPRQERLSAAVPGRRPAPLTLVTLDLVRERLIKARCEVMRREAILQLSRSGAGGDILTPLHQPHWPGDPAGRLTAGALEESSAMLNRAAAAPGNGRWSTMCQDVAVALSFYATVTRLFTGKAPLVVRALRSRSGPPAGDDRLIDDLAIARHAMRANSQLAAELLARLPVHDSPQASHGAR